MEEAEVPLENLQEQTHHAAEHGGVPWISWVAMSTAILAVLAAIAGLLSGARVNEAMMSQIEAANGGSYSQAKGIKAAVTDAKMRPAAVATAASTRATKFRSCGPAVENPTGLSLRSVFGFYYSLRDAGLSRETQSSSSTDATI